MFFHLIFLSILWESYHNNIIYNKSLIKPRWYPTKREQNGYDNIKSLHKNSVTVCSEFYMPLHCNIVMHLDGYTHFVVVSNQTFLITSSSFALLIKILIINSHSISGTDLYSHNQESSHWVLTNIQKSDTFSFKLFHFHDSLLLLGKHTSSKQPLLIFLEMIL